MTSAMPEDNDSAVPNHVAIVMDGNGRWAQERGDPESRDTGRVLKRSDGQ